MPMIGFTPAFLAFSWNSQAAWRFPWSVMASAGCSNSWARRIRSSIRFAPSRREYSEWQWRWTKDILEKLVAVASDCQSDETPPQSIVSDFQTTPYMALDPPRTRRHFDSGYR